MKLDKTSEWEEVVNRNHSQYCERQARLQEAIVQVADEERKMETPKRIAELAIQLIFLACVVAVLVIAECDGLIQGVALPICMAAGVCAGFLIGHKLRWSKR